jgi:hypothetical protein
MWVTRSTLCIVLRINTQTHSDTDMTIGNKRSRNIMHNHEKSFMETKISNLPVIYTVFDITEARGKNRKISQRTSHSIVNDIPCM